MLCIGSLIMDVLYITGRGGSLSKGLAAYFASSIKGFEGIAVDTQFLKWRPLEQVELIRQKMAEPYKAGYR